MKQTVWNFAVRWVVALWFVLIALIVLKDIRTTFDTTTYGSLELAKLFSKASLLTFVGMMAWLTFTRAEPLSKAAGWQPRISAFLGTNLIFIGVLFLASRKDLPITAHLVSAMLILVGNSLAAFGLFHLGRSFSIMAEARRLVTNGPYGIIRHPLYFAEQISILGVSIQYASLPMVLLVLLQFGFQIRRMLNEEALLGRIFPEYVAYARQTARLIPGVW
jgi:protein-S-isoprenylcysteine O-methyltransferase Ste14